ncbi:MAG TPA: MarR family transcriptional regulator [Rhodoblastus sp.]|nr:MarR family transcriptional regulator [Rhodoblastus sp.]
MTGNAEIEIAVVAPGTASGEESELARSLAYRLVVLAERVSRAIADTYEQTFELTRPEWRVLAALAANGAMTAKDLGPYSTLDKMQVSRAIQGLEAAGYVERRQDENDKRSNILRLTPGGEALYRQIRPRVSAREADILAALGPQERIALGDMIGRLRDRVDTLMETR